MGREEPAKEAERKVGEVGGKSEKWAIMEANRRKCLQKEGSGPLSKRVMRAWTRIGVVKEATTNQMRCVSCCSKRMKPSNQWLPLK